MQVENLAHRDLNVMLSLEYGFETQKIPRAVTATGHHMQNVKKWRRTGTLSSEDSLMGSDNGGTYNFRSPSPPRSRN